MRFKALILLITLFFIATTASATQIIVLNESEEKVYSLEDVLLSGDLNANSLSIQGKGEVINGKNVKVYLFGPSSDILVKNVNVNNIPTSVSFDGDGYFFIADGGSFNFNGILDIKTIGQVKLFVKGPVNSLRFDLIHGYAINGDQFGLYEWEVILQRAEKVSMIVDGNFKYTFAERDEFHYLINFKAYGSTLGGYKLNLPNGETVTTVVGAKKWEQVGSNMNLDFEGSQAAVTVRGYFTSTNIRIPLPEDRHHVLIESDAEKKISIITSAKELDLKESPLSPTYGNARAFLAARNDDFTVTVKKLDVLPSLAASVRSATNFVAITSKGSILGELVYNYANTGVDYIEIDAPGTPLYASTERHAVKLTKDNKLLLSFPKGEQGTLDFVYFTTRGRLKPFDIVDIPLARTDLPITEARTTIYLPKDYYVVETFGVSGGSELPTVKATLLYLIVVGIISAALVKDSKFMLSYAVFSAAVLIFDPTLFLLLIAATLALIVRKHIPKTTLKWLVVGGVVFVISLVVVAVIFGLISSVARLSSQTVNYEKRAGYAMVDEEAAPQMLLASKGLVEVGEGDAAITVPVREGVYPVKFEIPRLGKTISVVNHLVTKENQISLKILIVKDWIEYLIYLIGALAGIKCYRTIYPRK
ncbi:MAG: hypothetical protein V1921_00110 [Candidatus Altiarchaeota archaeon]